MKGHRLEQLDLLILPPLPSLPSSSIILLPEHFHPSFRLPPPPPCPKPSSSSSYPDFNVVRAPPPLFRFACRTLCYTMREGGRGREKVVDEKKEEEEVEEGDEAASYHTEGEKKRRRTKTESLSLSLSLRLLLSPVGRRRRRRRRRPRSLVLSVALAAAGGGGRRRRWKGTSLRTLHGGESRVGGSECILPAWLGWRLCHHYCRKRLAPKLPVRRRGRKAGSKSQFWSLGGRGRKKEKDVLVRAFKGEGGREEGTTAKSLAMQASLSLSFPSYFRSLPLVPPFFVGC